MKRVEIHSPIWYNIYILKQGRVCMANFTEKAIKESFMKLLNDKPLSKISVRDIVEDCGINRNSFYYHFQDIPTLLEEIITEQADEIIAHYPSISSLDECFNSAFQFAIQNKKAAFHICNSVSRDIFERELLKLCDGVVTRFTDTAFPETAMPEADKKVVCRFIKCELFGITIDWINGGMQDDAIKDLLRITELCKGFADELISRSEAESPVQ